MGSFQNQIGKRIQSVGAPNGATIKDGASPYNKAFELSARGRHGACLRKPRAGKPPPPYLPVRRLQPCSQLNAVLYGRNNELRGKKTIWYEEGI